MFFFFSKVLLIFILPLTWILFFLIAGIIMRKKKLGRRFIFVSAILLLIFTNPYIMNRFAQAWNIAPVTLKTNAPYSTVIVLGGFSSESSDGTGHFNGSCDRFLEGLRLFYSGKASHILITSGNGSLTPDGFEEADWVKTQLQMFRVPDSCIVIENRSRNTIENAAFSKPILLKNHLQPPYILVTSAFHMRRSLGIFKKTGIDVVPYPCDYSVGNEKFDLSELLPDATILGSWNTYIKELVGTLVNHLR